MPFSLIGNCLPVIVYSIDTEITQYLNMKIALAVIQNDSENASMNNMLVFLSKLLVKVRMV